MEICIPEDMRHKSFSGNSGHPVVLLGCSQGWFLQNENAHFGHSLCFTFLGVCLHFPLHTWLSQQTCSFLSIPLFSHYLHVLLNLSFLFGSATACNLHWQRSSSLSPGTFPSGTSLLSIFPEVSALMFMHLKVGLHLSFHVFHEEAKLWFQQGTVV